MTKDLGSIDTGAPDSTEHVDHADGFEPAGHFRVYLGAAAGAGKTCAMLNEGNRRKQRGTDVVVGFIECHGRPQTEKLIADLELVPRRAVEYRGSSFTEMDVDAVIRRNPQVALVDELAHTNVPGSGRNEKRWQDVVELLDAGVDVISAVNIQHLESIADAVEQITEVPIREHSRKEVGPMKKGKAPAKKAPADRAKVVKTKVAKPAKLSHRPKP